MHRFARECATDQPAFASVRRPFSNFEFVDSKFPRIQPLRRVFSLVRAQGATTMAMERLDADDAEDLCEENADLQRLTGENVQSEAWRLSFFRQDCTDSGLTEGIALEDSFLGYVILKRDASPAIGVSPRVYESVILPSRHDNNYIRGSQRWGCRVGDRALEVEGYLYAQQNSLTNCCSHVACRTVASRFHPNGDMTYREMNSLPEIGIDHVTKKADGLSSEDIQIILEASGARCSVADFTEPKAGIDSPPFQKCLYGSIESGYPAILFFAIEGGDYHTIPVFGHTFNEDTWVPNADRHYFIGPGTSYVPSEQWLSMYVAHDDNWGPNYCIPRHFLHTKRFCDCWPDGPRPCETQADCVAYVIETLPQDVKIDAMEAEAIGADYLLRMLEQASGPSTPWATRLDQYARYKEVVLRPILMSGSQYVSHLRQLSDWDGAQMPAFIPDSLEPGIPGKIWMVELSIPELFSADRRKLGEVILLACKSPGPSRDFGNFLLARLPGAFVFCTGGDVANPEFSFAPSGINGHASLYGCEDAEE